MGIGSCESSVMVEEPLCVAISGQRLCSEFALQSVGAELSHSTSDCEDLICNDGSTRPSSGGSAPACDVNGDGSTGEHEVGDTLISENLLNNVSGLSGDSLEEEENHIDFDECDIRSGRESLKEGKDDLKNSIGECKLPLVVVPVADSAAGSCLNESNSIDVACTKEMAQELLQESRLHGEDDPVKLTGECELSQEVMPMVGLPIECLQKSETRVADTDVNLSVSCEFTLEVTHMGCLESANCMDESNGDTDACTSEKDLECLLESGTHSGGTGGNQTRDNVVPLEVVPAAGLATGACMNENHSDIGACLTEKAGECLTEIKQQDADDVRNLTRNFESPLIVTTVVSLASGGCQNDIDKFTIENRGEFFQESSAGHKDDSGNLIAHCGLPPEVIPMDALVSGGCSNEIHGDLDGCTVERSVARLAQSKSHGERGVGNEIEDCELPMKFHCVAGGDCLNTNVSDINACSAENSGQVLVGSRTQDEGDIRNQVMDHELPPKGASVAGLATGDISVEIHNDIDGCSTERAGECLQVSKQQDEDFAGILMGDHDLPLEGIAMDAIATGGGCLNELQADIDTCNIERGRKGLQESRSHDKAGLGNLIGDFELPPTVISMASVAGGGCLNENHTESSKGEGSLGNIAGDCDLPLKAIPVYCYHQDGQKDDKSLGCLLAEDIKEATNKDDVLADSNNELCNQEPSLQDCESSELVLLDDGILGNTQGQKEQGIDSKAGPSSGNIDGKTVASVASEADICKKISPPLQTSEMNSEVSLSGEEASNCDWKTSQNNCIGRPSSEIIMEAAGIESKINTFGEISLLTSPWNAYKSETPNICVLEYEQNEKSVHISSAKRVTESVEGENNVISDVKVEAGNPVLPLEENTCSDRSASQPNHPLGGTDDGSFERLNLLHGNSLLDSVKSSNSVGCVGQTDTQGKDYINYLSEEKGGEMVSSFSQRNGQRSKSNRKTRAKKATRNSRKTAKALSPRGGIEVAFKPRKKRSQSRSSRSPAWGLLENVTGLFVRINRLDDVIPVSSKRSRKPKGDKKNEKKNKNGTTARAQDSKKKCPTSTAKLRLKVKIGKGVDQSVGNVTAPELVDTSALPTATGSEYGSELCLKRSPQVANCKVDDQRKCEEAVQSKCLSSNKGSSASCPGASVQDAQLINESESNLVTKKSVEDSRDDYFGVSSDVVEASGVAEIRCKDPGTSPDSEVINVVPDSHTDSRHHDDFLSVLTAPEDFAAPGDLTSNKKGKKKDKLPGLDSIKDKSPQAVRKHRDKPLKQYGRKQKCKNGICAGENQNSLVRADASINSSSDKEPAIAEPFLVSNESGDGLSKLENSKKSRSAAKTKGQKLPRAKSQHSDRSDSKKKNDKKSVDDQVTCKVESQPEAENHMADDIGKTDSSHGIASTQVPNLDLLPGAVCEKYLPPRNAWVRCDTCHKWRRIPAELADLIEETQCTWTCKDNVDKAFADCSTPQEKSNSDINAELEISDASGEEDAYGNRLNNKGLEFRQPRERQETVTCATIRTNQFLHRNRKTQTIDEIMVCHCKPHPDGRLGCGDDCLNRMLNIECAPGACPCGDLCSNQQFQKRKYAKLEKFHCGKKGYGLKLMEDIPKGKFLIEYVGEVLDMQAYESRQKEYALKGHKHFYFMTLNGNEVIDACVKGNKGRFINHSCDPNCRTEKWMVNGEICIGLFAMRDMKKGEEMTFDYNYVRVFGAAAKKCYCLSRQCRGYIGGDPLSGDVIIQSDSDEDYPKPVRRTRENRPGEKDNVMCRARSSSDTIKQTAESRNEVPLALGQSEAFTGIEDSINHSGSPKHDVLDSKEKVSPSLVPSEISQQTEDLASELVSTVQQESSWTEETPVKELRKSSSDGAYEMKSKSENFDDRKLSSKAHSKVKTSRSSSSVKNAKVENNTPDASKVHLATNKSQVLPLKPKKVMEGSFGRRFEAVEEKLNELLDPDGGISRRKDAAKGYLKLLLLTSASGGTANSEAIQRNRDLSMILDALLKTRSRVVLTDIINKNGLRMLHKIMKQYRGDFKKIPILRKLLKVLEHLATRGILSPEHIREGPPRPGMESFRESILSLTEHDDKQVHQIARNFRDRFIPKHLRRPCLLDWDDNRTEFPRSSKTNRYSPTRHNGSDHYGRHSESTRFDHSVRSSEATRSAHARSSEATGSDHVGTCSEPTDCVKQSTPATPPVNLETEDSVSASCASVSQTSGARTRKRKSRWDQPAETTTDSISLQHKEQKVEHNQIESPSVDYKDKSNTEFTSQDTHKDSLEDFPPGFSSPLKPFSDHPMYPSDTVIGHPPEKFLSRLPVSYGIPLSIVQRFGNPLEETMESWNIAPGMPFHPFPPLPPFPRDRKHHSPPGDPSHSSVSQPQEEASGSIDCAPSTTGDQPAVQIPSTNNSYSCKRGRESSYDLGRRYFKQQKWNHAKLRPPWHWSRNGWGCVGDSRGEMNGVSLGNVTNDVSRSTSCSEDLSYQHQDHHHTQN